MRRPGMRMRLALWCAALVTVSGAIVTIGVLALTGRVLHDRAATGPVPSGGPPPAGAPPRQAIVQRRGDVVDSTLDEARDIGLIVIGGLALASIGIGWLVAGRMLRPVSELAALAHEVSDTSLDRRIAMTGSHDELRELADAFDAMLDRLDAAFASQRRFVADASHELRTPLATIRAEVDSVADDPDATAADLRAATQRISAVLDRTDALVESLLTLSRSDAISASAPLDLAAVARDVVTATPGIAGLNLRLDLRPAPVTGDPALLERLAGNLVENATRYNATAGLLSVSTGHEDGHSTLRVANDGALLAPEAVSDLVGRFHRGERTSGGFGLGLAIADAIARGHHGTLTLRARPQGGLEVVVLLPTRAGATTVPCPPRA